jgi:16S rRNA (cytosine1402-N4)-methyltransferase
MPSREQDSGESAGPLHRPVLLREVLRYLDVQPGMTVVDGTVGAGGHSKEILKLISPTGRLIGLDRDSMMLGFASQSLDAAHCSLHQTSYVELPKILETLELPSVDRVLLDLGLSSDQLADDDRGFGFEAKGPLDLRFDISRGKPAWKLIEECDEAELADILHNWGEERFSKQIARRLTEQRKTAPVRTPDDLVQAVGEAVPGSFRSRARKHPATRVFQALRIAVNNELQHLEEFLQNGLRSSLSPGGKAVVISFHSLEDRLVKNAFRDVKRWKNLTTKPVTASAVEQKVNPRSRAAKLRAAIRL